MLEQAPGLGDGQGSLVCCSPGCKESDMTELNRTAAAAAAAKLLQSCPTLCDPTDGSPPGFPVPGILQARTLEWVAMIRRRLMTRSTYPCESEVAQSCPTLSDPMDCSLPGSSVHGVFQARVLEWGAIAFSNSDSIGYIKDWERRIER